MEIMEPDLEASAFLNRGRKSLMVQIVKPPLREGVVNVIRCLVLSNRKGRL